MKSTKILAPIINIKDLDSVAKTSCKSVYIYHSHFLENKVCEAGGSIAAPFRKSRSDYSQQALEAQAHSNYNLIFDFVKRAKELHFELYVNFKGNIKETETEEAKNFLKFLYDCSIDGILVNSIDILDFIEKSRLPFKLMIDSGLNIHNLAGIDFVNLFHPVENINVTEEIYIKNLTKIKKYSKHNLSIDTDNLSWIADKLIKNKIIDAVVIKGEFDTPKKLVEGIRLIEKILEEPKSFRNQKLPFRNFENTFYKSNHFSGEFSSYTGKDFKFKGNIQQFNWKYKRARLTKKPDPNGIPNINLRLTSLEQLKCLKKYIKNLKFNPVYSIEYGEILNTADLSRYSFNKIIEKVKKDCLDYDIKLQISAPGIMSERDFDRVYEYVKLLCVQLPYPDSVIVNNIGYWWTIINDSDLEKMSFELGQGLNLLNSSSILCLTNQHTPSTVDLSNFSSIENIKLCMDKIRDKIPNRKLTIAGNIRVPCLGLCPLNNESAVLSRLACNAPCHKGNYAVSDPTAEKLFPIAVDGFCRMHLFKDRILDLFKHIRHLEKIGINEFVIDCSSLPPETIPVLLNRFLNSLHQKEYTPDPEFITRQYELV